MSNATPANRHKRLKHSILGAAIAWLVIFGLSVGHGGAFSSGPPPSRTGAPGEATCVSCHNSFGLNSGPGTLSITGLPANYSPNQQVIITVTLIQSSRARYGFELTALDDNGRQAGTLVVTDAIRTQLTSGTAGGNLRQYIEHTFNGIQPTGTDRGSWTFTWTAPATSVGRVTFYAAGNAANGNGTTSGDFIYTTSASVQPELTQPAPTLTSLSPNTAPAGGPTLTLTVTGTGFISGSVVRWNGADRQTMFVSGAQLTAQIPAGDLANAGTASVTVFNPAPGGGSSNGLSFIITPPTTPRVVQIVSTSAAPGSTVSIPIELVSQGDENALRLSVAFDASLLSNPQATIGANASGALLGADSSQIAQGRFGISLALPAGQKFAAGTDQIAVVSFAIAAAATTSSTAIGFADQPTMRVVFDVNAGPLPANYTPGTVTVTPGVEADVAPRPNGNGSVTIVDWVQVGRFAAGLDVAAMGSEFQRADCAPKTTLGDGRMTIADWVQAGRYAAGLDPVASAGGPTIPTSAARAAATGVNPARAKVEPRAAGMRVMRTNAVTSQHGHQSILTLELDAQGDENALGFSLNFDRAQQRFVAATPGNGASGATLNVNVSQAAEGRIGITLALPAGQSLPAGTRQMVVITFDAVSGGDAASNSIGFGDEPIARELVDVNADTLATTWKPAMTNTVATVSAASYSTTALASESIAAAFGSNLATTTQSAIAAPLPISLAGTTVKVKDSAGNERFAPLFFVSPTQVNYQIPEGTVDGLALVTVTSGDGAVSTGTMEMIAVAPGLFTANANGQGVMAAIALRVKADGSRSYEPVARFDEAQGRMVSAPLDLGPDTDQIFLILFGTGIRFRSDLTNVVVRIGGVNAEVLYAGPQGGFVGLDQINLRVPRSLSGRGEVKVALTVGKQMANTIKVHLK